MERVSDEKLPEVLTLDSLVSMFGDLKKFEKKYKFFNLALIASLLAGPLLLMLFKGWESLHDLLHRQESIVMLMDLFARS